MPGASCIYNCFDTGHMNISDYMIEKEELVKPSISIKIPVERYST